MKQPQTNNRLTVRYIKSFFFAIATVTFATSSFANGSRPPAPAPQPPIDTSTFVVTPQSLRTRLMDENMNILLAANQVAMAKQEVNIARAALFPSINLSAVLLSAGSPTFMLSSIDIMLPFLLPTKWFELKKAKMMLKSDQEAYKIIQLNTYASAWSLYSTILNDTQLLEQLEIDADDWRQIEEKTAERFEWGLVSKSEMALARSQRALAALRVEKVKGLIVEEKANMRKALGLNLEQGLELMAMNVPAFNEENYSISKTLQLSYEGSSELLQLGYLEEAARADRWSRVFAFLTGADLGQSAAAGSSLHPSFDGMTGRGSIGFGAAMFPAIGLASKNIDNILMRKEEMHREMAKLVEVVKQSTPSVVSRLELANEAENSLRENFNKILESYKLGLGATLTDLLKSRMDIQEATTEKISAQTALNLQRISLARLLRTGEFSKIDGCLYPVLKPRQPGAVDNRGHVKMCTSTPPDDLN